MTFLKRMYLRWYMRVLIREIGDTHDEIRHLRGDLIALAEARIWLGRCEAELVRTSQRLTALEPFQLTTY